MFNRKKYICSQMDGNGYFPFYIEPFYLFPLSPSRLFRELEELLPLCEDMCSSPCLLDGFRVAHLFSFQSYICALFSFDMFLVCPMLPVFLDCPFLITLRFSLMFFFSKLLLFYITENGNEICFMLTRYIFN